MFYYHTGLLYCGTVVLWFCGIVVLWYSGSVVPVNGVGPEEDP